MDDKRVTLIVSDLHVGGGPEDPGDDHIYQGGQLARFLRDQLATPEGSTGNIELIFNGDFLEFAQTEQDAFAHASDDYWCSEAESCRKLGAILRGHRDIFGALGAFQAPGNVVTMAAGNHDVDLYWPAVQRKLRESVGPGLRFELGTEWYERYDGKLQISHGHIPDPANTFEHWDNPILSAPKSIQRLEMCPGTLFMVKFVNKLEKRYPFADNLQPVTKLVSLLARDDRSGCAAVAWMFTTFVATTSGTVLESDKKTNYGKHLLQQLRSGADFAQRLRAAVAQIGDREGPQLEVSTLTEEKLARLMFRLLGRIDDGAWHALFDEPIAATLGTDPYTLQKLAESNLKFGKSSLQVTAQSRRDKTNAEVVVMGHTHLPDELPLKKGGVYYNPGSWTRYLELERETSVTLDQLRDDENFPYQLNYIRVRRPNTTGPLESAKVCFEKST